MLYCRVLGKIRLLRLGLSADQTFHLMENVFNKMHQDFGSKEQLKRSTGLVQIWKNL